MPNKDVPIDKGEIPAIVADLKALYKPLRDNNLYGLVGKVERISDRVTNVLDLVRAMKPVAHMPAQYRSGYQAALDDVRIALGEALR